jgi:hypothetical protein
MSVNRVFSVVLHGEVNSTAEDHSEPTVDPEQDSHGFS